MKTKLVLGAAAVLIVAAAAGSRWWQGAGPHGAAPSGAPAAGLSAGATPALVTLAAAQRQDVAVTVQVNGSVVPLNSVDLKPQVTNTVREVHVKEGQFVKAGQLLFSLDDRPDQANLAKARAQQQKDEAMLADLERQYRRSQDLVAQNFIAKSAVDATLSQLEAQRAAVAADRAAVQAAQVALGYNTLRAPIAGRIGAVNIYPGTLVQSSLALVTITQLDPIAVSFPVPEGRLQDLLEASRTRTPVEALVAGRKAPLKGTLSFVDNTVDPLIGTVRAKAVFENADQSLWPGQFVETRVIVRTLADATVLPASALMMLSDGSSVYVVDDSRKAMRRKVQSLYTFGTQVVVRGVEPGERVVIEGKQNVRNGGMVRVEAASQSQPPADAAPGSGTGSEASTAPPGAGLVAERGTHVNISELCIRRPAMTVLLSAAVVVIGIFAYFQIPVAALPSYNTPVINVNAQLPGASPDTMASSVALPLEKQFSTIPGLQTISSVNTQGVTSITLEFVSSRDIDAAAVDVQAALLRAQRQLPVELTQLPSYRKVNPADAPVLFIAMVSESMNPAELNDYAENLVSPTLSTIDGVAQVGVYGRKAFAVRIKADANLLNARNITLDELANAVRLANANTPVGVLDGPRQTLTIQANEQMLRAADFARVIVGQRNGAPVRLDEVATIEDSFESVKTASSYNGQSSISLAVQRQPNANTVQVVDAVRALMPRFRHELPQSIEINVLNDRSLSIREAVHDVQLTLMGTILLVVLVIFLFLHRLVATLIPALTIPISLVGAVALLFAFGYSLDNVSLLGITLAVGLVVDDAIVVLENIMRYVEKGMEPFAAALRGAREVGFTIVSISISLVAVFIPIFFMPGVIGLLFHEFAVVVGLAVAVSAVVSLTLVPMLASRLLKHAPRAQGVLDHEESHPEPGTAIGRAFERLYRGVHGGYLRSLDWTLHHRPLMLLLAASTFAATAWMFITIPKGFFPEEDIGQIQITTEAAEDISFPAMQALQQRVADALQADPSVDYVNSFIGVGGPTATQNSGRLFAVLKPRSERPRMPQVLEALRKRFREIPGIAVYMQPVQNLRLGGRQSKARFQYTLQSVNAGTMGAWAERLMERMRADPAFRDVTSDSQNRGLQATLDIDRDKAGVLGVAVGDLRTALYNAYGDRQIGSIYAASNTYQVILSAADNDRQFEDDMTRLSVRNRAGQLVPLSAFSSVRRTVGPTSVNHQGQLQAVTVSFNLAPDVPLGNATAKIDRFKAELKMPASIITNYGGDAAVFQSSQSSQAVLLILAVLVIYVLLGVLYESYIHPLTILAGLPSAAVGALLSLKLFGFDLTLIATIGILLLIGIVKKNAIMLIDFALEAQRSEGMAPVDAIREACRLRFRPILMTTLAAMMGALPLALGLGAGAELRQPLGVAVVGGLIFSQVITLYITPAIYLALDRYSGSGPVVQLPGEAAIPAAGPSASHA